MKKVLIGVVVLLAIIAGGAVYLFSSLDSLVKTAIETAGSQVTGVKVTVSDVKISLSEGKGTLKGLTVANPSGFSSPNAFRLGEISIAIDPSSVTKDPVVIRSVTVGAPEVTYELNASGSSNIQAIQNNVQAATAGKSDAKATDKGKSGPKLVVDRLDITNGKVKLATPIPGAATEASLADIHLTGIGRNGKGVSAEQLASAIIQPLVQSAIRSAASVNLGKVLTNAVGGATSTGSDAVQGLKGLLGK